MLTIALYHQITQYSATNPQATSLFNDYQQKTNATLATDMPATVYQPEYKGRDHRNG